MYSARRILNAVYFYARARKGGLPFEYYKSNFQFSALLSLR